MIRAHKIRLYPNNVQETYLKKACGIARFAYNNALGKWCDEHEDLTELQILRAVQKKDFNPNGSLSKKEAKRRKQEAIGKAENCLRAALFKNKEYVNENVYRKELNAVKKEQYPWMQEVTKYAPENAIRDGFGRAFKHFFGKERFGFPKFHKKGHKDSFTFQEFGLNGKSVRIPKLGWVKMAEELRFEGKYLSATVSRRADHWYISISVEIVNPEPIHTSISEDQAIGVDVGIKDLAILSNGIKVTGNKPSRKYGRRLRRLQQSLSRKQG